MSDHVPTLADVCSAIAEGHLAAASDGSMYQVNAFELRRYFNRCYSFSPISLLDALSSTCSDSFHEWSLQALCSSGL